MHFIEKESVEKRNVAICWVIVSVLCVKHNTFMEIENVTLHYRPSLRNKSYSFFTHQSSIYDHDNYSVTEISPYFIRSLTGPD